MQEVSIQPKHYLTCLWPGMAELWWRGRLSALPAAIAFAAVVNALLIAKFIFTDWLSGGLVMLACWVVVAAWIVLAIRSAKELPLLLSPRTASEEPDRFSDAQIAYLKGDYAAAEDYLTACLSVEPRDPPALLMLSAVYRQTGRLSASQVLLSEIRKLEVAEKWDLEFTAEEARLERDIEAVESDQESEEDSEADTTQDGVENEGDSLENASQDSLPDADSPETAENNVQDDTNDEETENLEHATPDSHTGNSDVFAQDSPAHDTAIEDMLDEFPEPRRRDDGFEAAA